MKPKKIKPQSNPIPNPNLSITSENQLPTIEASTTSNKLPWVILGILIFLIFIIRSNFKDIPFERDEGCYAYQGYSILKGKMPYIDFYEMKFPFLFYAYASIVGLFGFTINGLHTGFMLLNAGAIVLAFLLGKQLWQDATASIILATGFAFMSLNPSLSGFTIQSEHFIAFFTLAGLNLLYYSLNAVSQRWYFYFAAGVCMALAFMIKPNAVFIALAGAGVLALEFFLKKEYKKGLINGTYYALGGLLAVVFFLVLSSIKGSWEATRFWVFEYAQAYVGQIPWKEGKVLLQAIWRSAQEKHESLWYISMLGIGLLWFNPLSKERKLGLLLLLLASCLTVVPGFRFFGHYWLQMMPLVAVFFTTAWVGAQHLLEEKTTLNRFAPYTIMVACGLVIFLHIYKNASYYFETNDETLIRTVYGKNPFLEAKKAGDYIKSIAKTDDQIMLVGAEPEMYIYTGLDTPTRHYYFAFMVQTDTISVPQSISWVKEFSNDIVTKKPRFIAFFKHEISTSAVIGSAIPYFNKAFESIAPKYKVIGYVETKPDFKIVTTFGEAAVRGYVPQTDNLVYIFELNE